MSVVVMAFLLSSRRPSGDCYELAASLILRSRSSSVKAAADTRHPGHPALRFEPGASAPRLGTHLPHVALADCPIPPPVGVLDPPGPSTLSAEYAADLCWAGSAPRLSKRVVAFVGWGASDV